MKIILPVALIRGLEGSIMYPEYIERKITVIDGQPFYQSSGTSSHYPQTWFPFKGIYYNDNPEVLQMVKHAGLVNGCFEKGAKDVSWPEGFNDTLFVETELNSYPRGILGRFFNFESLYISSLIENGFWKQKESKKLKKYIQKYITRSLCDKYKNIQGALMKLNSQKPTIEFHGPAMTTEKISEERHFHAKRVNDWLAHQKYQKQQETDLNTTMEINVASPRSALDLTQTIIEICQAYLKKKQERLCSKYNFTRPLYALFSKEGENRAQALIDRMETSKEADPLQTLYAFFQEDTGGNYNDHSLRSMLLEGILDCRIIRKTENERAKERRQAFSKIMR